MSGNANPATELYIPDYLNVQIRSEYVLPIYTVGFTLIGKPVFYCRGNPFLSVQTLNCIKLKHLAHGAASKRHNGCPDCQEILSVLTAEWWRCVRSDVEGSSGRKVDGFQSQWTAGRH